MRAAPSLSPGHVAALSTVARLLAQAQGPWWVIAGAAVALHGGHAINVDDIDILFSESDGALVGALPGLRRIDGRADDRFRSRFYAASSIGTVEVEWMAGFAVCTRGTWRPVSPRSREPVRVGDATVFVPSRRELIALLRRFGRPKDLRRIALLAE